MSDAGTRSLLDVKDPVIERNSDGGSPLLLVCDHYGREVPPPLGDLGLPAGDFDRHIAFDIGIAGVAERLSDALGAQLIAQRYSRLVIDCNRPPIAESSIPLVSESTVIPGNDGLTHEEADERRRLIFDPYHHRIEAAISDRLLSGTPTVLLSLHSFTPVYHGVQRPWHIGTLYQNCITLPPLLLAELRREDGLVIGDNQPYAVTDGTDYTIPVHGTARGLINSGLEIRQDQITDEAGQTAWAERLARILTTIIDQLRDRGVLQG